MVKFRFLNCHVMELAGMCSSENLTKTDVILSSPEAAICSIIEATSSMDWWTLTVKSKALQSS